MPKELPKVDLEDPSDLDYIADAVRRYALDVGKERLRARSQRGGASALEETMAQALDRWVYAARTRLMHNVLINGLTFGEYSKQEAAMEPFDEQLASRVSALSDEVDEMTERVVACRKRIPSAYAQAVQQRSEALSALIDAREERRQRKLRKSKPRARFPALMKGEPLCGTFAHSHAVDVEAKARTEEVLRTVYTQLHQLRSSLPERQHTAEEQQRLVSRLRQMPP